MNRREFVRAGLATTAAFSLSGLTLIPRRASAVTINLAFAAERADKVLVDGRSVPVWRFLNLSGSGPGALTAGIVAREGDVLEITLFNDLDRPLRFVAPGAVENAASVDPGASRDLVFPAPAAGTYLFHGEVDGALGLAMGLGGPMVILPAGGSQVLYDGGPVFDRQYTLVLTELDDRCNHATAAGRPFDLEGYEPNYFFVNGLGYPDTSEDAATRVVMTQGERVALRFVNAGLLAHSMHFHGYHVEVASRDRVPETAVVDKDTVLVAPGECVDVILPVTQTGTFPLHTHYVPGVTADGVYLDPFGGALVIMEAS